MEGATMVIVTEVPGGVWQLGLTVNTRDNARLIVACSSRDDFAK